MYSYLLVRSVSAVARAMKGGQKQRLAKRENEEGGREGLLACSLLLRSRVLFKGIGAKWRSLFAQGSTVGVDEDVASYSRKGRKEGRGQPSKQGRQASKACKVRRTESERCVRHSVYLANGLEGALEL